MVERQMEDMLPELEDLVKRELFTQVTTVVFARDPPRR